MNFILRLIFMLIGHQAKLRLLREAKKTGVVAYLRVLQSSRYVLVAGLLAFLMLQFMVLAAFGAIVAGVMLLDQDFKLKLEILFWFFTAMFTLPALALAIVFSERVWYRYSGAQKMVEDLRTAKSKRAA